MRPTHDVTGRGSAARCLTAALALVCAAGPVLTGCGPGGALAPDRSAMALQLAETLEREARAVEDESSRDKLVTGLRQIREVLAGPVEAKPLETGEAGPDLPPPADPGGLPLPQWATLFTPTSLVIGFFTRSKDFDGDGGLDGLEVRLQPIDRFGDPTKAVGWFRVEVFQYQAHSTERRGARLGHWFVSVADAEANEAYYDPIDRSYVLPLLWQAAIAPGTAVIVQATYYPPGGFGEKLIAQRAIKVSPE